ncbi:hypothetical protein [Xenorhabdus bharatensis]|uniref:hypothetical protein n=1 Tax=Xenorhabdus bharatensis TaxID=3136256 RepID=UPI0030F48CC4
MLRSIYKYKVESFFNENALPFDHQFLFYENYFDYKKKKNMKLCFKRQYNKDSIELISWGSLFREYMPQRYWEVIPDNLMEEKEILGFSSIDYYNIDLIFSRVFFIFDINKEVNSYRKELAKFHYQYQSSHYKGNDDIRLFFIRKLLFEMWVWDLAYDKLSIKNSVLTYTAEGGASYPIHELVDRLCDIIRSFSLPKKSLELLDFINLMLHECIDFILGESEVYDFKFDEINEEYIDGYYFLESYQNDKKIILNVLKNCVRDSQSSSEIFVSHLIIRNYSFFVLKNNPDEILLLKSFLSDHGDIFLKILSLVIDIGFCVWKDTFDGLNLEEYLEKVEESDFLLDR